MIAFRHADPRLPFLWENELQPPARWHGAGDGPAQYLADTPDGAWAEFLRHEEIRDPADLVNIRRAVWAVDLQDEPAVAPVLPAGVLTGDRASYPACQIEARRLRNDHGATRIDAPSAALLSGGARGWRVDGGLREGPLRDGRVVILYGSRPTLIGWKVMDVGQPSEQLLPRVRHF